MKLSLIVPCYNEEKGIENLHSQLNPVLESLSKDWELELIFVDDGSKDRTLELLNHYFGKKSYVKIVPHEINKNLGAAMRTGFAQATGDIIVTMDSDCTYDPKNIPKMLKVLDEDTDMVTASPYHPLGNNNIPKHRLFLSKSITGIYCLLTGSRIYTFTALFRAYKKEVIQNVAFKSDDFLATAEILILALNKGYKVREYPTTLNTRAFGDSKIRMLKVIKSHFLFASGLLFLKLFKKKK
ncbi:MAG: glycosyltransferase family 2 protein [Nanoarchaeota archaeon]